jgi:hypothetical protein
MGFFSDIKDDLNWQRMQRMGIRQVTSENRMESCDMCRHFRSGNESCGLHGVVVNKTWWTCGSFDS